MAISNYTELTDAISAWLDVSTESISSVVSNLVLMGEARIMRELRTPEMETAMGVTISSGVIAVPTDLAELKYAYVDINPTQYLQMVPTSYIYDRYPTRSSEGKPQFMARDGSNFIFGPYPDSDYVIRGTYFKHLTGVQTTINGLFTANPDLYLFACLAETEPLLGRDPRVQLWEAKYRMVKELVNGEANGSRLGGNLSIRPG